MEKVERILEEKCPECGFSTIEEKHWFKSEELAVCICGNCDFYNWVLPKTIANVDIASKLEESREFQESKEWAEKIAEKMRVKHGVPLIPVTFSENVKWKRTIEIENLLKNLCRILGYKRVYVGKYYNGIRIEME